jgi:hypothetical protein
VKVELVIKVLWHTTMHFMIGKDKQMDLIYGSSFSGLAKIILFFKMLKLNKIKVPSC